MKIGSLIAARAADRPLARFRAAVLLFAAILVVLAAWISATEAIRPPPLGPESAVQARTGAAATAAWVGLVRGELWVDYASRIAPAVLRGSATPLAEASVQRARAAVQRGLVWSPHDASGWLVLAGLSVADAPRIAALRMSYFTNPVSARLTPARLGLVTRAGLSDPDLKALASAEILTVLRAFPVLRSSLTAAYETASPAGRRFIESAVADLDPALARDLERIAGGR